MYLTTTLGQLLAGALAIPIAIFFFRLVQKLPAQGETEVPTYALILLKWVVLWMSLRALPLPGEVFIWLLDGVGLLQTNPYEGDEASIKMILALVGNLPMLLGWALLIQVGSSILKDVLRQFGIDPASLMRMGRG